MPFDSLAAGPTRHHPYLNPLSGICSAQLDVAVTPQLGGPPGQQWTSIPCLVSTAPRMPMSEALNPLNRVQTADQTTSIFTDEAAIALGLNMGNYQPAFNRIRLPGGYVFEFHFCEVRLDFLIGPTPTRGVPVRFPVEVVAFRGGLYPARWLPLAGFPRTNILMMNGVLGPATIAFDSSTMHGY